MPAEERDVQTFLLTDVEGSTRLWEDHPDATAAALVRHDEIVANVAGAHAGRLVKPRGEGDSAFLVFSAVRDAVAAALRLQQAFASERWPEPIAIRVRMALHCGPTEQRDADFYGPTINRCARLRAAAHGGQIVLSDAVAQRLADALPDDATLVDLGVHRLRDLHHPERVWQLSHPTLGAKFPPLATVDGSGSNLPEPLTSFVGRGRELAVLVERSAASRLVTLFGPGGAGKTRLAVEYARSVAADFPDGAWFADLSPISDGGLVSARVAQSLWLQEDPSRSAEDVLVAYLAERAALLVIDNCEHVVDASAHLVSRVLAECPQVRVIATSRELLRVYGEAAYPIPPLSTAEDGDADDADALMSHESARLFAARADLVDPGFGARVDLGAARLVAQLCRRLEGMPLAIELAAAMLASHTLAELTERLDARLTTLDQGPRDVPRRQQTLRAAIDWSHDMLPAREREVFRRLAVFAGGADETAAIVVVGEDGSRRDLDPVAVPAVMRTLAARSLVVPVDSVGEPRYRFLETIREYALERLEEHGDAAATRDRHLQWCRDLVVTAASSMRTSRQAEALELVEREQDNVRAAFDWAVSTDTALGAELAVALSPFWADRGSLREGGDRLSKLLDAMPDPSAARGRVLVELGNVAFRKGERSLAATALAEGLALTETHDGDDATAARAVLLLAAAHHDAGELDEAEPLYHRALTLLGGDTSVHTVLACLNGLGLLAINRNDYAGARRWFGDALAGVQRLGDLTSAATVLGHLGYVEEVSGDLETARRLYEEQIRTHEASGNRTGAAWTRLRLGNVLANLDPAEGISVLECALVAGRDTGNLPLEAGSLGSLGLCFLESGRLDEARDASGRALALHDDLGMPAQALYDVFTLARVAERSGDHATAEALGRESLRRSLAIADRRGAAIALRIVAAAVARRDLRSACRLVAASRALRTAMSIPDTAGESDHWLDSDDARQALLEHDDMDVDAALLVARDEAAITVLEPAETHDRAS